MLTHDAPTRHTSRTLIPDALFTPSTHSRCRGVYPLKGRCWEVKVRLFGRIHHVGKFHSSADAIAALTGWYAERFGPHWEYVATCRESNPWKIVRHGAAFALYVWLFGNPRHAGTWPTKAAACEGRMDATAEFLRRELSRLGFSPSITRKYPVLWRTVGAEMPPPTPGSVWWAPKEMT